MYGDRYEIKKEKSLDFLNSFDVPETEVKLVNEEENYTCHVKEMLVTSMIFQENIKEEQ